MTPPAPQPAASTDSSRLIAPAFTLSALALCYLPALTATFGFADDYPHLLESQQNIKWVQQAWNEAARPVGGFLTEWSFRAAGTIAGMAYLRAAALLLLLVLALAIYRHLLTFLRAPALAGLATVFICTQPPFLVTVGWASLWLYLIPALLSYAAYHAKRWFVAMFLLYLALNIYPPSTMFLWFWFGTEAILSDARPLQLLQRFLRLLAICGAACVVYFAIYKSLGYHNPRGQFSPEMARKIEWFIRTILTTASRLDWFECVSRWLPLSVWLLIAPGIFLLRKLSVLNMAVKAGLCAAVVFLSYLPLLVVVEMDAPFRSMIVLAALIAALVFAAVLQILTRLRAGSRIRYLALAALVAAGVAKANANLVSHFVVPQSLDYAYLKGALAGRGAAQKKVVIIGGTLTPKWHWDELRLITSVMPDDYHMLSAMAQLIAQESWRGPGPAPDYSVQAVPHGTRVPPSADTAVIDMQAVMDMLSSE